MKGCLICFISLIGIGLGMLITIVVLRKNMWIDTHNHFDFDVFDHMRANDWARAQQMDVSAQFVMSIAPSNFERVASLAESYSGTYFALGIHPLFINDLELTTTIEQLRIAIESQLESPKFIGIGEIGLDFYIKGADYDRQVDFFTAQLKLAHAFGLPVFMHVRKSQDVILKYCRRFGIGQGIAHAFNGSHQQAEQFIAQGFKLGFGGAFTYPRAKQLRRLVMDLPLESFVLETDAPDMPPEWAHQQTNYSYHLPRIAQQFAQLRGVELDVLAKILQKNTEQAVLRTF